MEAMLAELEPLLRGSNYAVFLRVYRVPFTPEAPPEWYVSLALGTEAVVGGVAPVTGPEILAEVEQSLRHVGDAGSGPRPSALRSQQFNVLVPGVLADLEGLLVGATVLASFWLRQGHPAYPVFWDFAFVIAGPAGGVVFIGSASD